VTAVVLAQGGELDIATIGGLMQRLEPHRKPGGQVVLDLREVVFIDCYSLSHIVGAHADSATEGWTLRIRVEAPPVLRLLELTGAANLLPLELPTGGGAVAVSPPYG
jgi:anti-anti-sigma factor